MDQQNLSAPSCALITTPAQQLNERFADIYTEFQPRILRLVLREVRGRNFHLAEDLTADAFVNAWRALPNCRATCDAQLYAWLATIARRTVMAHYRVKRNTCEVPTDTGTWQYADREMVPAGAWVAPARNGDSDPDMDEALRRARQPRAAVTR